MIRIPIPEPGPPKVFGLSTSYHLMLKLHWEMRQLRSKKWEFLPVASYRAFNCAVTAWHLSDWIWHELADSMGEIARENGTTLRDLEAFQAMVRSQCRPLLYCYWIANGSKHKVLRKDKAPEVQAKTEWGVLPAKAGRRLKAGGDPFRYGTSYYVMDDGTKHDLMGVLQEAAQYWRHFMQRWGLMEDSFVAPDPPRRRLPRGKRS